MSSWWEQYKSNIPAGKHGNVEISKFSVEKGDFLHASLRGARVVPGNFTRLTIGGRLMMTDTPDEIYDQYEIISYAKGRVLIHGLGLGITVAGVLKREEVTHVDVVEKSADVIALVAPHLEDPRLTIHHDDCFTKKWKPGTKWDYVWHDIWYDICVDNLTEMAKLHHKFGKRCGWQASWKKEELQRIKRENNRSNWWR